MKKAYVVAEIQVTDPVGYEEYKKLTPASIAAFGGAFVVRGGTRDQREGEDGAHDAAWRTVILEFPSMEQARRWYDSPEYAHARDVRQAHSTGRLFIVEGV